MEYNFNKAEQVAYAQLYDFCNYTYEPATEIVELKGDKADKLISSAIVATCVCSKVFRKGRNTCPAQNGNHH